MSALICARDKELDETKLWAFILTMGGNIIFFIFFICYMYKNVWFWRKTGGIEMIIIQYTI